MSGLSGRLLTVTVTESDAGLSQLFASITCTANFPEAVTLMDWVVLPLDHLYVLPASEVRLTLSPSQKVVGPPGVMSGFGGRLLRVTVTESDAGLSQPAALVT